MKKLLIALLGIYLTMGAAGMAQARPLFLESYGSVSSLSGPADDDVYTMGGTVNIAQPVKGDLIVFGGNINVDADISGDVVVAGGTVNIRSNVGDDLRVAGGEINIEGTVGDDVVAAGGSLRFGDKSLVKGDVQARGGAIALAGHVQGNVETQSEEVTVDGVVDGNARLTYSHPFTPGANAKIGGTLEYFAPDENLALAKVATSAVFHKHLPPAGTKGFEVTFVVWEFLAMLLLGGLIVMLLPKFLPRAVQDVRPSWLMALWQGFLVFAVLPILGFFALLTLVGWPVTLLLLLFYGVLMLLAVVTGAMYLGSILVKFDPESKISIFGSLAAGLAVYVLLILVPVVGWLVKFGILLIGLGALYREIVRIGKAYR